MAVAARSGINGLVYISNTEIEGANAWTISLETDNIEYSYFGGTWKRNFVGLKGWSGTIGANHDQAARVMQDAALASIVVDVLLYPDRTDNATFYNGDAIFSFSSEQGMDAAVARSVDFVGDNALSITGFA
jgi:hypothetical protein